MFKVIQIFIPLYLTFTLGCASQPSKSEIALNQELQQQPAINLHGGVAQKGFETFLSSRDLNDKQKKDLVQLHSQMARETFQIQDQTSKLKVTLFETLAAKPYDRKKVLLIKKKLISLNDKKMKNMLDALDKAQAILGESAGQNVQDYYRPFIWESAHQGSPTEPLK